MENTQKKEWSAEELLEKAKPAIENDALRNIAAKSRSPNRAAEEAEKRGFSKELIQTCRWLAILKRDYPTIFRSTVPRKNRKEVRNLGASFETSVTFNFNYSPRKHVELAELKESIRNSRERLRAFATLIHDNLNGVFKTSPIGVNFSLEMPLRFGIVAKDGKQYIEIRSRNQRGRILRDNGIGLGAQSREAGSPALRYTQARFKAECLIVDLFPKWKKAYEHRYTDRGVCWVHENSPRPLVFIELRNWVDPSITEDELVGFIELANKRVHEVVDKVLNQRT